MTSCRCSSPRPISPLAPAIARELAVLVERGDTGYTPPDPGVAVAYAAFAERRFGWAVDPARVRVTCDVMMGVVEILRAVLTPGDRVVVTPPVYPPFYDCVPEAGGVVERVPLRDTGGGVGARSRRHRRGAGIRCASRAAVQSPQPHRDRAHAGGARASRRDRGGPRGDRRQRRDPRAVDPPGVEFTPFLSAGAAAERVGFAVVSASKAFNLAGLKCALMVTASDERSAVVSGLPAEVEWRTGLFGARAALAAFAPESDEWLDGLRAALDANRRLLADLLAEHLPRARYRLPDAGFLAWVDLSDYGWGDNPAVKIRREAKVAFHLGPYFGAEGAAHVRINFGCAPEVLREAIERTAALVE
ncbi:hypothetical protein LUZ63_021262 [Rhynchospora breviuscula]|uniref:cysteine-S-conjugate beta-lyase n=1 Tax=Rhynchospora breviuscula TaxID=2022672 RepID=A0A9Q0C003_9POAL|nr:hypothetical protein LUZ63_021262 [Rhynchospora breviuscula]